MLPRAGSFRLGVGAFGRESAAASWMWCQCTIRSGVRLAYTRSHEALKVALASSKSATEPDPLP